MVDFEHGKAAVTRFSVVARIEGRTLVNFYPETGRTHQLRVHAAHHSGLNCPIVGDNLYGKPAHRLMLHAAEIEFTHPVTGQKINITATVPFVSNVSSSGLSGNT
jgi:tRNA pseudouridine32 synthase/23S rRNA pseudouridine746 synthase